MPVVLVSVMVMAQVEIMLNGYIQGNSGCCT